jgi:hypothetical protein
MLHMDNGHVCSTAAFADFGRVFSTASMLSLAASARVCPSVLQHTVLPGGISFLQHPILSLAASARVCPTADCAANERVCQTEACAASRRVSTLWQPVLSLDMSGLQQPCRPWTFLVYRSLCCPCIDVSLLHKSVLFLDVCVCLFYSTAVYSIPGGVWLAAACASPGHTCSTAACAVSGSQWSSVQQLVLHLQCSSTRVFALRLNVHLSS